MWVRVFTSRQMLQEYSTWTREIYEAPATIDTKTLLVCKLSFVNRPPKQIILISKTRPSLVAYVLYIHTYYYFDLRQARDCSLTDLTFECRSLFDSKTSWLILTSSKKIPRCLFVWPQGLLDPAMFKQWRWKWLLSV